MHDGHGDNGQAQVDTGCGHVEGERQLGVGYAVLRLAHDFFQTDYRHQGGVFHQNHEQIAQAWQGHAPHLRQDQFREDPGLGQP
ncbi:hypothetical protein D3C79_936300 [compost metagenome]